MAKKYQRINIFGFVFLNNDKVYISEYFLGKKQFSREYEISNTDPYKNFKSYEISLVTATKIIINNKTLYNIQDLQKLSLKKYIKDINNFNIKDIIFNKNFQEPLADYFEELYKKCIINR